MQRNDITSPDSFNDTFFKLYPVSYDIATALFEDLNYGLKWRNNWFKWQSIISEDLVLRKSFDNELFTYFGLSRNQINEFRDGY